MKKSMKKILALMLSVSTIVSAMSVLSGVAHAAEGKPTVRVEIKDPVEENYTIDAKNGYTPYVVNYYISDFGMDTQIQEKDTALAAISMSIGVSDNDKIEQTSWAKAARSGKNKKANGQFGDVILPFGDPQIMEYKNGYAVFSWYGNQIDPYDWDSESGNEEKLFFSNIVYIENNSSVTLTFSEVNVDLCEYDGSLTSLLKSSSYSKNDVVVSSESFTLGTSAPAPKPVTAITVQANDMVVGDADQTPVVTVTPTDADDTTYTLSSSNTDVATIVNGKIHAIAAGTTTITATANDNSGVTGSATITVSKPAPQFVYATETGVSSNKKAKAWGLTIKNFDSTKSYTAKFTKNGETKTKNMPFDSTITGSGDIKRIIIIESFDADADQITFVAECN